MIWHNDVEPDFPVRGFYPDRPQQTMVFVGRQPGVATLRADGDKNQRGLMLSGHYTSSWPNSLRKWVCAHNIMQ